MKGLIGRLLLIGSHASARLGYWQVSATLIFLSGPLSKLDRASRGRLLYASLMAKNEGLRGIRKVYVALLKRELDTSCENNFLLAAIAHVLGQLSLSTLIYKRSEEISVCRVDAQLASTMFRATTAIASGAIYDQMSALINDLFLEQGKPIVLVTVGGRYLELFELWFEQARTNISGAVVAICLDSEAKAKVNQVPNIQGLDVENLMVYDDDRCSP